MGYGFFDKDEVYKPKGRQGMPKGCASCGLYKKCNTPKMKAAGKNGKGVLFIAETPSEKADKIGKPLSGKSGQQFKQLLKKYKFDLEKHGRRINAVNCSTNGKAPSDLQLACCRPRVKKEIKKSKPKVIVLLGRDALESYIGDKLPEKTGGINKWRGWTIPDRVQGCWVVATYNPRYAYNEKNPVVKKMFEQDIAKAIELSKTPFPYDTKNDEHCIDILTKPREIQNRLETIHQLYGFISIDWETTGLKPYAKGHEIVTASIAVSEKESVAFPVYKENLLILKRILKNPKIQKTAHNLKFENTWSREIFRCWVQGWLIDTMLSSHILDNRSGICGLKFQTAVNCGVFDYDSHLKSYLQGTDPKNANSFNRVKEAPLKELLLYNGLDSLYGYRIAIKHLQQLEEMQCSLSL